MTGFPVVAVIGLTAVGGCLRVAPVTTPSQMAAPVSGTANPGGGWTTLAAPGIQDPRQPWAFFDKCGFVAVDEHSQVIVGNEVDGAMVWRRNDRFPDLVRSLQIVDFPVLSERHAFARLDADGHAVVLRLDCSTGPPGLDVERLVATPSPDIGASYSVSNGAFTAARPCTSMVGNLCAERWPPGPTVADVVPTPQFTHDPLTIDPVALVWNSTSVVAIATESTSGLAVAADISGAAPWGPATSIDASSLAPMVADHDVRLCDTRVFPNGGGPPGEAAYLARCIIGQNVHTFVGWLNLGPALGLSVEAVWHAVGAPSGSDEDWASRTTLAQGTGAQPGSASNARPGVDALAPYLRRGAQAFRAGAATWLIRRHRAEATGANPQAMWLVASCLTADEMPSLYEVEVSGPVGLRTEGDALIVCDAVRTQRLPCR